MKVISEILALCFFFGSIAVSCKKDKDAIPPVVSVTAPAENNSFAVFDTIKVSAEISDESQLTSVSIQLLQENLTPAQSPYRKTVNEKNYSLRSDYIIYDAELPSAVYFLKISASDGENETREYIKIHISEPAARNRGIFIISTPFVSVVNVTFLDSAFNAEPFLTRNCDYISGCVSSKYQYINLLGESLCGLTSFRINDKMAQWNEPPMGSSSFFTHLDFYNEISYVCYNLGNIRGFDKNGALQFSAVSNAEYYPLKTFLYKDALFVEEKEVSGDNRRLSMFYSTGSYARSAPVLLEIVAFAGKDDNNIFLFGNENGQGKILIYNISENQTWSPYSVQVAFKDAVQINQNTCLVALPDAVYKYDYSPVNFIKFIDQAGVEKLKYDQVNNVVLASGGNMLGIYNSSNGQQLKSYLHSEPIKDFHLLYNK